MLRDACIHQQQAMRRQQAAEARRLYEHRYALTLGRREIEAHEVGIANPGSYAPIVLLANQRRIVPLSRRRRYRFAVRLYHLLRSVDWTASSEKLAELEAGPEKISQAIVMAEACATCLGHCCTKGGTHAYLEVATIQRIIRRRSQASLRDVLAEYCRYLPHMSYEDSCVFHSAGGCTLPWELRSKTCHSYLCLGLGDIHHRMAEKGETRFFLAASDHQAVLRSKFLRAPPGLRLSP
jgi:hypothetical protein